MKVTVGIDIGGSTTKIAGFTEQKELLGTLQVKASDQMTCMFGAFGSFLNQHQLHLDDISKIILTGVGSSFVNEDIYGIPTHKAVELDSIGRGGLMLSGLKEALVVSMGTGTAFVRASSKNGVSHVGGSGVGGGTLSGLAARFLHESDIFTLSKMADSGDMSKVDLLIGDIFCGDVPSLNLELTASNFGKLKSGASDSDVAAALFNLVYQTAGVLSVFACRGDSTRNVVLTGSLACFPQAKKAFDMMNQVFDVHFVIPEHAAFATAIGAVISYLEQDV